jgi:hypothetical protein
MEKSTDLQIEIQSIEDPLVRINMVRDKEGFMPESLRELNEVFDMGSKTDRLGGAARHMNDILLHQKHSLTDDPTRAVRSVAREYVGYYESAVYETEKLELVNQELKLTDNPELKLNLVFSLEDVGLAAMLRFMDFNTALTHEVENNPLVVDYTKEPKPKTVIYIQQKLQSLRVGDIRRIVPRAIEDQEMRSIYWHNRLEECVNHSAARLIVKEALRS